MSVHVVLAAGGTGGHIEPALSTAEALRRLAPDTAITVVGSDRGLESTLVPARGFELVTLPSVPLPRRPSTDLLRVGPRVRRAVGGAADLMRDRGTRVVLGFGGYAAMPSYLAARRVPVPLLIHESNARAGLANRVAARFATHAYAAYPGALATATPLATPLNRRITSVDRSASRRAARAHFGLDDERPVLLAFGGSQGARRINVAVLGALEGLVAAGVQVLHAYGSRNEALADRDGYRPLAFIDRMDLAYAAADLALSRAGALTCAELTAVGLPAVYVPLPIGNGEQRLNAAPVLAAGGGLLVDDDDLTSEWLTGELPTLLHDGRRLSEMSAAARAAGARDADEQLARIVLTVGGVR